jgi:hypothetical protein
MGRRIAALALSFAAGCAGGGHAVVKPSALDPALAPLDREEGRSLEYPVVEIARFDGFLGEAARVEATVDLARRLGGELRAAVLAIARAKDVPRAEERVWTALARELAARDDLSAADRERLRKWAAPLATLVPLVEAVPGRAERLAIDGAALIEGAHRDLAPGEAGRLPPALDALNVAVVRLREAGSRAPHLAAEISLALDGLGPLGREAPAEVRPARGSPTGPGPAAAAPAPAADRSSRPVGKFGPARGRTDFPTRASPERP